MKSELKMQFRGVSPSFSLLAIFSLLRVATVVSAFECVNVVMINFETHESVVLYDREARKYVFTDALVEMNEASVDAAKRAAATLAGASGNLYLLEAYHQQPNAVFPFIHMMKFYLMEVKHLDPEFQHDRLKRKCVKSSQLRRCFKFDYETNSHYWSYSKAFLSRNTPFDNVGLMCVVEHANKFLVLVNEETGKKRYPSDGLRPEDEGDVKKAARRVAKDVAGVEEKEIVLIALHVNPNTNAADLIFLVPVSMFLTSEFARQWATLDEILPIIGGNARVPSFISRIVTSWMTNSEGNSDRIGILCVDFKEMKVLVVESELFPESVPMNGWLKRSSKETITNAVQRQAVVYAGVGGNLYSLDTDLYLIEVNVFSELWPLFLISRRKWLTCEEAESKISNPRVAQWLKVFLSKKPNSAPFDQASFVCFKKEGKKILMLRNIVEDCASDGYAYEYPRCVISSADDDPRKSDLASLAERAAGVAGDVEPLTMQLEDLGNSQYGVILYCVCTWQRDTNADEWRDRNPSLEKIWLSGNELMRANRNDGFMIRTLINILRAA